MHLAVALRVGADELVTQDAELAAAAIISKACS
jgi:predicted nucleic acid-binding protein